MQKLTLEVIESLLWLNLLQFHLYLVVSLSTYRKKKLLTIAFFFIYKFEQYKFIYLLGSLLVLFGFL